MRDRPLLPQGADLLADGGVRYRAWSTLSDGLKVRVQRRDGGDVVELPLAREASGYHHVFDENGSAGDLYQFVFPDGRACPDPASRWQPRGVHEASMVIDPCEFTWTDSDWQRPPFRDLVIDELHLGTFTAEGTFLAAIERLPHLAELGVTAIELLPVADFPGERNWGYDGVLLYAPARAYGHPDDLRALVDAAHRLGLTVILDVVYNHFGPDGNYLGVYSPSFQSAKHETPWGAAINFDGPESAPVRAFYLANLWYWMEEFHIDAFRLDATHAIIDESPRHILEEMAELVQERGGYVIAEDERNEARLITPREHGGYGFNAVWADDFCHTVMGGLIRDPSYAMDFTGGATELVDTLHHGWGYRGKFSEKHQQPRGTECRQVAPERFVWCLSNHDQAGNRALGERLHHLTSAEAFRAATTLLCLGPYTPMLFMGEEWAASAPFRFFTDHHEELGQLVTAGRRREFRRDPEFSDPEKAEKIPDPQALETFTASKLNWAESEAPEHAPTLALYRELLRLRRENAVFRPADRASWAVAELSSGALALRWHAEPAEWLLVVDLAGGRLGAWRDEAFCEGDHWRPVLGTNEARFGGTSFSGEAPEALLFVRG